MKLSKTEEALCNGVLFSVPRLVAPSVQEGELENAQYYVYVLLTPAIDKLVMKIWKAPDYSPIQIEGEDVETFTIDIHSIDTDEETPFVGYKYDSCAYSAISVSGSLQGFGCNSYRSYKDGFYDGLMIYPAIKCMMVDIIMDINKKILREQSSPF